jgi:hypothetical protein
VELDDVDPVRTKTPQACLDAALDCLGVVLPGTLRSEDDLVPPIGQPLADDLFAGAAAVAGRVST